MLHNFLKKLIYMMKKYIDNALLVKKKIGFKIFVFCI